MSLYVFDTDTLSLLQDGHAERASGTRWVNGLGLRNPDASPHFAPRQGGGG